MSLAENLIDKHITEVDTGWAALAKLSNQWDGYKPEKKKGGVLFSFDSHGDMLKFVKSAEKNKLVTDLAYKGKQVFITRGNLVADTDGPWTQW